MSQITVKPIVQSLGADLPAGVTERVVEADGTATVVRILDARRQSFGTDLAYVFGRNVSRAREENRQLTGSPDGATLARG